MSARIRIRGARGSEIGADLGDDLLRLRLRNVRLKDATDPAMDRQVFLAWIARASWVSWCEDEAGLPCAMTSWRFFDWQHRGERQRGGAFEYYFIDAHARGSAPISLWIISVVSRALWQARSSALWIGGAGAYPQSTVGVSRFAGHVHYLGEPGLGDEPRVFLERLLVEAETRASSEGIVEMRTVPQPLSHGWARRHAKESSYRRYLAINPRWEQGHGVVMGARLDSAGLVRLLRMGADRLARGK